MDNIPITPNTLTPLSYDDLLTENGNLINFYTRKIGQATDEIRQTIGSNPQNAGDSSNINISQPNSGLTDSDFEKINENINIIHNCTNIITKKNNSLISHPSARESQDYELIIECAEFLHEIANRIKEVIEIKPLAKNAHELINEHINTINETTEIIQEAVDFLIDFDIAIASKTEPQEKESLLLNLTTMKEIFTPLKEARKQNNKNALSSIAFNLDEEFAKTQDYDAMVSNVDTPKREVKSAEYLQDRVTKLEAQVQSLMKKIRPQPEKEKSVDPTAKSKRIVRCLDLDAISEEKEVTNQEQTQHNLDETFPFDHKLLELGEIQSNKKSPINKLAEKLFDKQFSQFPGQFPEDQDKFLKFLHRIKYNSKKLRDSLNIEEKSILDNNDMLESLTKNLTQIIEKKYDSLPPNVSVSKASVGEEKSSQQNPTLLMS